MGKRGRRVKRAVALALAASFGGQSAFAFLDTGTLLTNAASATYMGGGQGTSVTYSATAKILVANPAVFLWKDVTPTIVGTAGGLVTYTICFSNGGANTGFNVTINDRLPNNSFWNSVVSDWWINTAGVGGPTVPSYSFVGAPPYTAGYPPAGQGSPLFLRWVVGNLGVGKSGCIVFVVSLG